MALENTVAQYQIEIVRTGSGAQQAVQEFNATATAAASANAAMATGAGASNAALANLGNTSKGTFTAFKALQSTATAVGLTTFPQMTLAVHAAKDALHAVRASGVAVTAGLGLTAAAVAGLTAIVLAGVEAWITYKAAQEEKETAEALDAQTKEFNKTLKEQIDLLHERGELTNKQYRQLSRTAPSLEGNQQLRDFLTDFQAGTASEQIALFERRKAHWEAENRFLNPGNLLGTRADTKTQEAAIVQAKYIDQVKLYNELREQGLITERELSELSMTADTNRLNRLIQIKAQLSELQVLEQKAVHLFASGLSQAMVDFASSTKSAGDAFKEFAASFLQEIAKMILEMEILAVLKAIGFGASGGGMFGSKSSGLGASMSEAYAHGGIRFAAGGLSGVSSVSSPTYFPRFNVLAGEAGREMLTVLARPRMMEVGGVQAVVGNAGNNRLAITNAEQLAGRGGGGTVDIRVTLGPELRAEIVQQSVEGARVRVQQDLTQDTPISRGVKGLTG